MARTHRSTLISALALLIPPSLAACGGGVTFPDHSSGTTTLSSGAGGNGGSSAAGTGGHGDSSAVGAGGHGGSSAVGAGGNGGSSAVGAGGNGGSSAVGAGGNGGSSTVGAGGQGGEAGQGGSGGGGGGCAPGETASCYTGAPATKGVGACTAGVKTCGPTGVFGKCEGEVLPSLEVCNAKDDNCNGVVDDGLGTLTCGLGECQTTVNICAGGQPNTCVPKPPQTETCNGKDDNCNGTVDEGNPGGGSSCNTGQPGVCAPGTMSCQNGVLHCSQNAGPSAEKCDSIDNDCDGTVDDGNPGGGASCTTGLPGVCSAGAINCQNGGLLCLLINQPSTEVCDGKDNDCDGSVDEGNPGGGTTCSTGLPGACSAGVKACQNGAVVCSPNKLPSTEICDGIDNDCDGGVDEGNPGGGASCSTGFAGVCAAGTVTCAGGALTCAQNTQPSAEVCDGKDNDCNGFTDDNPTGTGAGCSTGLPGICAAGTVQCQTSQLKCVQNNLPTGEICNNGLDDNCDGITDPPTTVFFSESFANNNAGWQLDPEWQIGTALAGPAGNCADPGFDTTPTTDNRIAGVTIGGCSPSSVSKTLHGFYYLTSPIVNTATAPQVTLQFNRWLISDYTPYMNNVIEVFNGTTWVQVWQSGSIGITDTGWQKITLDITAQKNAQMRVRWGFDVGNTGVFDEGSWSIDDVQITSGACN